MKQPVKQPVIQLSYRRADALFGFECFWLMYVTGFNPDQHCMKCLQGYKSQKVKRAMPIGEGVIHRLDEAKGEYNFLYLCGVSAHFKYDRNLHVVFVPEEDSVFHVTAYNGVEIMIGNARRVGFDPLPEHWNGYSRKFTTCRNFQFGVHYYGAGGNDGGGNRFYSSVGRTARLF